MRAPIALFLLIACGEEDALDLCVQPATFPSDGVILRTPADVDAIREATELSGLFACEVGGLESVELPSLERVVSSIDFRRCPDLRLVSMPSLRSVEMLRLSELTVLERIDFDALEEATGSLSFDLLPRMASIRFPHLVRSATGVHLFRVPAQMLHFPSLAEASYVSISESFTATISFPELAGTTGLSVSGNSRLLGISLPKAQVLAGLDISQNPRLTRIDLSNVEHILGGPVSGGVFLPLPASNPEVDLRKLRKIDGRLSVAVSTGPDLSWLSSLESVGQEVMLTVGLSTDITGLDALTSVGGGLFISGIGEPERVLLPSLRSIGGTFVMNVRLAGELSAPGLETAGGIEIDGTAFTTASTASTGFAALREVSGDVKLLRMDGLRASALLPALERVSGELIVERDLTNEILLTSLVSVGSLKLTANTATIASFPALATVEDELVIFENASLAALELPSLASVGSHFIIANNPVFPTCEAEAFVARLGDAIGGETATTGNDEAATCGE